MPKRKITYILSNVTRPLTFEWIVDSQIERNFDLSFILMNPGTSEFEDTLKARGYSVHRVPYYSKKDLLRATLQITRLLRLIKPDIVHTHLVDANLAGLVSARICRVPKRIHTRHHSDPHHLRHRHAIIYDRLANFLSTDIVVASQNVKNVLMKLEFVPESKIRRISFGLKFSDYDSITQEQIQCIREKYALTEKAPIIGMVSRYLEIKGIQYAIPAFREFLKTYPNACLLIANAHGAYSPTVKELLRTLPQDSFREIIFENHMIALYKIMDIFIHVPVDPVSEAFGQAYTESLAAARPAIFTLSGIAPEFIKNQDNAIVVEFRNSEQILMALLQLTTDKSSASRMAQKGSADVRRLFTLSDYINQLDQLYQGTASPGQSNLDSATVAGFGDEWKRFDQKELPQSELKDLWNSYFRIFPWASLPTNAVGIDVGCGSGRWAQLVAPRVGKLHLVDPSPEALEVARSNLSAQKNCEFHCASVGALPIANASLDFGYSLGVLHHVPDTQEGIRCCVAKLKKGAPFLIYLYYRFDNRPRWFVTLWKISDFLRKVISRFPHSIRYQVCQAIAAAVYFPFARSAKFFEKLGLDVSAWPLSYYRDRSFYTMRTDALDRFGTRLEQRFTAQEIQLMLKQAGLDHIVFSPSAPYWCAMGLKQ